MDLSPFSESADEPPVALLAMPSYEEVVTDYRTAGQRTWNRYYRIARRVPA